MNRDKVRLPKGWEDITVRKPLRECKKSDFNGYFYNKRLKEIGHTTVFLFEKDAVFADTKVGDRPVFEGYWLRDSDTLFPPDNYLKIRKKRK